MHRTGFLIVLIGLFACIWLAAQVQAQPPEAPSDSGTPAASPAVTPTPDASSQETGDEAKSGQSLWEILTAGGIVGMLIMLLSIAAAALVLEHLMTIRKTVLMPPGLADTVRELLSSGQVAPADMQCRSQPSFLAHVLGAGLAEVEGGWPAVEKAVEDATAEQSARLFRKIEYLSVIGNIAPMMGLLGTVIGMIFAFREVADTQGAARAADLAQGIYLALVTTVEGLIVAIPSLAAFAVFRNRVDHLVAESAYVSQHVFLPLKRGLTAGPPRASGRQIPPAAPPDPSPPPVGGH